MLLSCPNHLQFFLRHCIFSRGQMNGSSTRFALSLPVSSDPSHPILDSDPVPQFIPPVLLSLSAEGLSLFFIAPDQSICG